METKICNCCKIEKNISDFSNNKRFEDNKNPTCKECDKMRSLKYYYSNKELVKLKTKEYIKSEKYKLTREKYLKENREEINRVNKLYKLNNREKVLQDKREYYQRKKNDPIFALTKRLRQGIYRSIRGVKLRSSLDILGCTEEKFKIHIENQFTDDMSWDRLNEIHIDHIIPISSAETLEDVYRLNHYTNLQPLWARDNIQKYNKIL
jgi:transposase-like protein